ncbi:MAG: hypothetical protein ACK4UT_01410 [Moraxellaceae bacterium]
MAAWPAAIERLRVCWSGPQKDRNCGRCLRCVRPLDCNFFRAHDCFSVANQNFYADRLRQVEAGQGAFDLPPLAVFDGKLAMALPFLAETRDAYPEAVRALFPYTTVIRPDALCLPDGGTTTLEDFLAQPQSARAYYLKYGGTDVAINWGSRSVYLASGLSAGQRQELVARIRADAAANRWWVLQEALRQQDAVSVLQRDGTTLDVQSYGKWSGLYGPDGLMGVLVMHKHFSKVHGSEDTVMSIVY